MSLICHLGHSENDSPWKTEFAASVGSNIWTLRFTTKELEHRYYLFVGAELLQLVGFDVRKLNFIPPFEDCNVLSSNAFSAHYCAPLTVALVLGVGAAEFEF